MTLIASVRCTDGIVLCADSQETVGVYRVAVTKLEPKKMGEYQVLIAGSGVGPLIDAFILRMENRMENEPETSIPGFKRIFEKEFGDFRRDEMPAYQPTREEKRVRFIVAVVSPNGEYEAWVSPPAFGRLRPVRLSELVGWEEALYTSIIKRLCKTATTLSIPQAILACVHLMTVAEENSNFVKGPFAVAIVVRQGIWMDSPDYVEDSRKRLADYESQINTLFLTCADSGLYMSQFNKRINEFVHNVTIIHKMHLINLVRHMLEDKSTWEWANEPYKRIPPGFNLSMMAGDFDDVISSAEKTELQEKIMENFRDTPYGKRIMNDLEQSSHQDGE
jgi:hypothetical protein